MFVSLPAVAFATSGEEKKKPSNTRLFDISRPRAGRGSVEIPVAVKWYEGWNRPIVHLEKRGDTVVHHDSLQIFHQGIQLLLEHDQTITQEVRYPMGAFSPLPPPPSPVDNG
jgi:hypothetical protein